MDQVGTVVRLVTEVFGPDLVGIYLHGSSVLGGLKARQRCGHFRRFPPEPGAAADWALRHLAPRHRPVLEHARQLYLNHTYEEETWSEELRGQVRAHVDEVLAHIRDLGTDDPR